MTWNDISSSRIQKFRDRKNYHAIRLQSQKQNKQNENQTNEQTNKQKKKRVWMSQRTGGGVKEKAMKRFYGSMSVTSASDSKLLATVEPATPPPTTTIRFLSAISSRTGTCKWRDKMILNLCTCVSVCFCMCAYVCLSVCSSECLRMLKKKQQRTTKAGTQQTKF
jgi:hypothetical protein